MHFRFKLLTLVTLALMASAVFAAQSQPLRNQSVALTSGVYEDESIKVGALISHPEAITGAWEAWVAPDKTVGISIALITTVDATTTLRGVKQYIRFVRIVTYVRNRDRSTRTWWHSEVPGGFDWRHNRLRFHQISVSNDPYDVDLDIAFDPAKSRWKGSFKNPDFAGQVVLKRPDYSSSSNSPVGTWKWGEDQQFACIHVGMGIDGQLVIWSDEITLTTPWQHLTGLYAPVQTDESYGELADDPMPNFGGERWLFQLGEWSRRRPHYGPT